MSEPRARGEENSLAHAPTHSEQLSLSDDDNPYRPIQHLAKDVASRTQLTHSWARGQYVSTNTQEENRLMEEPGRPRVSLAFRQDQEPNLSHETRTAMKFQLRFTWSYQEQRWFSVFLAVKVLHICFRIEASELMQMPRLWRRLSSPGRAHVAL